MNELRILIAGGRDFNDFYRVEKDVLKITNSPENIDKDVVFISGMAKGADAIGVALSEKYESTLEEYLPEWNNLDVKPCVVKRNRQGNYNALAGFARNQRMLDEGKPTNVLIYWDKRSSGTKDMINRTEKYSRCTLQVNHY